MTGRFSSFLTALAVGVMLLWSTLAFADEWQAKFEGALESFANAGSDDARRSAIAEMAKVVRDNPDATGARALTHLLQTKQTHETAPDTVFKALDTLEQAGRLSDTEALGKAYSDLTDTIARMRDDKTLTHEKALLFDEAITRYDALAAAAGRKSFAETADAYLLNVGLAAKTRDTLGNIAKMADIARQAGSLDQLTAADEAKLWDETFGMLPKGALAGGLDVTGLPMVKSLAVWGSDFSDQITQAIHLSADGFDGPVDPDKVAAIQGRIDELRAGPWGKEHVVGPLHQVCAMVPYAKALCAQALELAIGMIECSSISCDCQNVPRYGRGLTAGAAFTTRAMRCSERESAIYGQCRKEQPMAACLQKASGPAANPKPGLTEQAKAAADNNAVTGGGSSGGSSGGFTPYTRPQPGVSPSGSWEPEPEEPKCMVRPLGGMCLKSECGAPCRSDVQDPAFMASCRAQGYTRYCDETDFEPSDPVRPDPSPVPSSDIFPPVEVPSVEEMDGDLSFFQEQLESELRLLELSRENAQMTRSFIADDERRLADLQRDLVNASGQDRKDIEFLIGMIRDGVNQKRDLLRSQDAAVARSEATVNTYRSRIAEIQGAQPPVPDRPKSITTGPYGDDDDSADDSYDGEDGRYGGGSCSRVKVRWTCGSSGNAFGADSGSSTHQCYGGREACCQAREARARRRCASDGLQSFQCRCRD